LTDTNYGRNVTIMAIPKIKATYSLDEETVRALEKTAKHWKVSKSEVVRRAILATAAGQLTDGQADGLRALNLLQAALGLDATALTRWEQNIRGEREAYADRLQGDSK